MKKSAVYVSLLITPFVFSLQKESNNNDQIDESRALNSNKAPSY